MIYKQPKFTLAISYKITTEQQLAEIIIVCMLFGVQYTMSHRLFRCISGLCFEVLVLDEIYSLIYLIHYVTFGRN